MRRDERQRKTGNENRHDLSRMVIHAGVPEVESLEVTERRRFDDFRRAEALNGPWNDGEVVVDEREFIRDGQVRNRREIGRGRGRGYGRTWGRGRCG